MGNDRSKSLSPEGVRRIHQQRLYPSGELAGWYIREYDSGRLMVTHRTYEVQAFYNLDEAMAFAETMTALRPRKGI